MGGLIGFKLGLTKKDYFRGIIMLAPAIKDNQHNSYYGKKFLSFLSYLFPRIETISVSLDTSTKNMKSWGAP